MKKESASEQLLNYFADRLEFIQEHIDSDIREELRVRMLNKVLSDLGIKSREINPEMALELQAINWLKFNSLSFASVGKGFSLQEIQELWNEDLNGFRSESIKLMIYQSTFKSED